MPKGFKISEQTPDRQYFTLVPNYIVNHSNIWEQGVYLAMKRIAGERGSCYATHQTIADMLKISRPTVSKTIQKLLKRKWIREIGTRPGKTRPVREYQVVDLWKINVDYYRKKIRKPENISSGLEKDTSTTEHKIRKGGYTKKSDMEEDNTKRKILKRKDDTKSLIKRKKKFSSITDLSNGDFEEIAQRYDVPVAFVKSKYDDLVNYCQAKGRRYKNYKFALMKFVKKDAIEIKEKHIHGDRKRGIDATNL